MEFTITQIRKIAKALGSDKKVKLLNLCVSERHNFTELKKKIGLTIQSISVSVRELENAGLVETEEVITERGRNIMVKSKYYVTEDGFLRKLE